MKMLPRTQHCLLVAICICLTSLAIAEHHNASNYSSNHRPGRVPLDNGTMDVSGGRLESLRGIAGTVEARIPGLGVTWFRFTRVACGVKNGEVVVLYECRRADRVHRVANYYVLNNGFATFIRTTGVDLTKQQIAGPDGSGSVSTDVELKQQSSRGVPGGTDDCPTEC